MNFTEITPYIENMKPRGSQYVGQCPVCGDEDHLYIKDEGDKVLLYCQKCNAPYEDIKKALGMDKPPLPKVTAPKKPKTPQTVIEDYDHIYRNPDGSVAYNKNRVKYDDGKKKFTFWYESDGEKVYKKPDDCNCLYNLDLLESAPYEKTLYIVEGEKCADSMTKAGFLCTTANGGANSVKLSVLDRAMLDKFPAKVIIPDNDEKGQKYIELFPDCNILNLDDIWINIKPKQDIADYIESGHDLDLIRNYKFPESKVIDLEWYKTLTAEELISRETLERLYAIDDKFERDHTEVQLEFRASELKMASQFKKLYKTFKIEKAKSGVVRKGNVTDFPDQPIALSCGGWTADINGVRRQKISNQGNSYDEYASTIPILPAEILENINTGVEKLRIDFHKNGWKSVICDRVTAASNAKIIELANSGIEVNSENAKLLVQYIADCVALNNDVLPRSKAVSQMGWCDGVFMPYADGIRFDGERENKHLYEAIGEHGDYDLWLECVSKLRSNIYLRLAMAASFASPLIEVVSGLPFVFNLWGGTGNGKSVALMIAMSIWGNPAWGKLSRTMNSTTNSIMATAAFLRNLPYSGDELQTIKSTWDNYDKLIMCICEGVERGRMNYDRNNETRTWKCSFIFTGEEPCTQSSSGGGAKNRAIDVECKSPVIPTERGSEIVGLIMGNHGHAGKVYIEHIKKNRKRVIEMYRNYFEAILKSTETTEKQAMAVALMITGDMLARECIFTEDEPIKLSEVKPFMASAAEIDTSERAYQYVVNLIAQHEIKFNTSYAADIRGEMWGKLDSNENTVMFNKDILVKQMRTEGYEFDAVKSKWADKGYLILTNQNRYHHHTRCNGIKAMYIKIVLPNDENVVHSPS